MIFLNNSRCDFAGINQKTVTRFFMTHRSSLGRDLDTAPPVWLNNRIRPN